MPLPPNPDYLTNSTNSTNSYYSNNFFPLSLRFENSQKLINLANKKDQMENETTFMNLKTDFGFKHLFF